MSPPSGIRRRARLALTSLTLLLAGAVIGWSWSTVRVGAVAMAGADREWLTVAGAAAALTWLAASGCQLGCTTARLPLGRVFAVQVAGSFVNHLLPAGLGGAGLTMRMLARCGLSRDRAAGAIALNLAAGLVVHMVTLSVLVAVEVSPGVNAVVALGVPLAALAGLAATGWLATRRSASLRERLSAWIAQSREVLARPSRALLLWTGSAAVPALHIVVLLAVLHSLDASVPVPVVALAYLSASAVSALLPTPGGFGGLDVALAAALVADGLPGRLAVSVVIGYRLVTVWLPLLPGIGSLLILLHRRAV